MGWGWLLYYFLAHDFLFFPTVCSRVAFSDLCWVAVGNTPLSEREPQLSVTVYLPLNLKSEESISNKCFLIMQIFRARKPANMATPRAVPMMAYLISEVQRRIEQRFQWIATLKRSSRFPLHTG